MLRDDFELNDEAGPSHPGHSTKRAATSADTSAPTESTANSAPTDGPPSWDQDAEKELRKIPFFVRGKAKRNTEKFAADQGLREITMETLYEAKSHFSR